MARVSIYVQDELKARMDRIGEAANWSEVVRPAILSEVASHEHRKGKTMATVVERLRASRIKHDQEMETLGTEAGRTWASDTAEFAELQRVSKIEPGAEDEWAAVALSRALDPNGEISSLGELSEALGLLESDMTNEFLAGFIEGATDVFNDVKDEL